MAEATNFLGVTILTSFIAVGIAALVWYYNQHSNRVTELVQSPRSKVYFKSKDKSVKYSKSSVQDNNLQVYSENLKPQPPTDVRKWRILNEPKGKYVARYS